MTDSSDFVVEEIDLILSKKPNRVKSSYLIQYPSKLVKNESNIDISTMRMKKDIDFIEQNLSIDLNSQCFSSDRANFLAKNAATSGSETYESDSLDKIKFISNKVPYMGNIFFAIEKYNDKILEKQYIISKIDSVLQMEPNFAFLDHKTLSANSNIVDGVEPDKLTKVSMRVKKVTNSESLGIQKYHSKYLKYLNTIPWTKVLYYSPESDLAQQYLQYFMNAMPGHNCSEKISQYLSLKMSKLVTNELETTQITRDVNKSPELNDLPLKLQIEKFMIKMHCAQFQHVIDFVGNKCQHETILSELKSFCLLVDGVWVINSTRELTDNEIFKNNNSQLSKAILARDFLLYKLNNEKIVNRKDFSVATRLPSSLVDHILNPLCKNIPSVGWKLRLEADMLFLKTYPREVERQISYWETQGRVIHEEMQRRRDVEKQEELMRLKAKTMPDFIKYEKVLLHSEIKTLNELQPVEAAILDHTFFANNCLIEISSEWLKSGIEIDDTIYLYYPPNYPKDLLEFWNKSPIITKEDHEMLLKGKKNDEKIQLEAILNRYCIKNEDESPVDFVLKKVQSL